MLMTDLGRARCRWGVLASVRKTSAKDSDMPPKLSAPIFRKWRRDGPLHKGIGLPRIESIGGSSWGQASGKRVARGRRDSYYEAHVGKDQAFLSVSWSFSCLPSRSALRQPMFLSWR